MLCQCDWAMGLIVQMVPFSTLAEDVDFHASAINLHITGLGYAGCAIMQEADFLRCGSLASEPKVPHSGDRGPTGFMLSRTAVL